MSIPVEVIRQDHELEATSDAVGSKLAELRWHWTLDELNPSRVGFREYGRAVGRNESTIRRYVKAHQMRQGLPQDGADPRGQMSFTDALERASVSAETEAATEAVADAHGISLSHARKTRQEEIKRVRGWAERRVAEKGTAFSEEVPGIAEFVKRGQDAEQRRKAERKERVSLRAIELEGLLGKMKRTGVQALNLAAEIEWGDEERELLAATVGNVRALVELIDLALTNAASVDWDAELEKMEGAK